MNAFGNFCDAQLAHNHTSDVVTASLSLIVDLELDLIARVEVAIKDGVASLERRIPSTIAVSFFNFVEIFHIRFFLEHYLIILMR
jgi:hypothetical protein